MNRAKLALANTKQFVSDHKVAIAVVSTAAVCTAVHLKVIRNMNTRMKELGIDLDTFYSTED